MKIKGFYDKIVDGLLFDSDSKLKHFIILQGICTLTIGIAICLGAILLTIPLQILGIIVKLSDYIYEKLREDPNSPSVIKSIVNKHFDDLVEENRCYQLRLVLPDNRTHLYKKPENKDYTLSIFIDDFFVSLNNIYHTYNERDLICDTNRRRSLGDLRLIVKYYFPEVTNSEFMKCIISKLEKGYFSSSYCNTIKKFVIYKTSGRFNDYDEKTKTEIGRSIPRLILFQTIVNAYKD